jgi:arginyl-tRNA synthetase
VLRKLESEGMAWDQAQGLESLARLEAEAERDLVTALGKYPETVKNAAANFEPHQIANYLRDLASDYHTYYNGHKMLIDDAELRNARITLSVAVRQVLANGLKILGVSAPEQM